MNGVLQEASSRRLAGVALSDTALIVPGVGVWPLAPRQPGYDQWQALKEALVALAAQTSTTSSGGGRLAIALLPPLASIRSVTLPKMRDEDLHAVLTRNVGRYFPMVRESQTTATVRTGVMDEGNVRYTVAAVPSSLLAAIEHAAASSGWVVDRLIPAYAAWATIASARKNSTHAGRSTSSIIIRRDDGGTDVMSVANGVPHDVRRLRAGAPGDAEILAGAVTIDQPSEVAARQATQTHSLEILTPTMRTRRLAGKRSMMTTFVIAAGVVLVAGLGTMWWHMHGQLNDIKATRATLAPQVVAARRAQAALLTMTAPAQALARVETQGVRWSAALTELTEHLPPDAYVEGMRASNDSLSVDVAAQNGARVFQSVAASSRLSDAIPVGPIRRDDRGDAGGAPPLERFTLLARIPDAAPLIPPPTRGHRR